LWRIAPERCLPRGEGLCTFVPREEGLRRIAQQRRRMKWQSEQ